MDGIFTTLRNNLIGMKMQLKRLETISQNIANAERIPDENGQVYRRKVVVAGGKTAESRGGFAKQMSLSLARTDRKHLAGDLTAQGNHRESLGNDPGFRVAEVGSRKVVYDPTNPRSDENGYLLVSDINVVEEMVDMIEASRAYEANVTVMNAAKEMAKNTLKI